MLLESIKNKARNNKTILANFSYISVLQVFILLTPLITYPYLTRVLGTDLYGLVITAQILSSYATIVVKFGFDSVSARHVSIWRNDNSKLSEIVSSILSLRLILWIISFTIKSIDYYPICLGFNLLNTSYCSTCYFGNSSSFLPFSIIINT